MRAQRSSANGWNSRSRGPATLVAAGSPAARSPRSLVHPAPVPRAFYQRLACTVPSVMETLETTLDGPVLLQPRVIGDERGFFCETYRQSDFKELGIQEEMVQDNHSRSRRGIVRGMHFQIGDGASKLVRCARGAIWDVLVDLRRGSPTFGQWEGFELTEDNLRIAYCPIGFAHGFCVLSEVADVLYKQSNYYSQTTERGIAYDDPEVGIDWPLPVASLQPSQRDASAPRLREIADELPFVYAAAGA